MAILAYFLRFPIIANKKQYKTMFKYCLIYQKIHKSSVYVKL